MRRWHGLAAVSSEGISFFTPNDKFVHRVKTPPKAKLFVNNYDAGNLVKPFKFKLDIPE